MRNLTTYDTRFRFCDILGGQLGEMPSIEIRDKEEIPPLNKSYVIYVDIRHDELAKSRFAIVWAVSDSGVTLKLYCPSDDSRLKKQYQANPSVAETILNLLLLPEERGKVSEQYRRIQTQTTISKEEIPELLRPFVTQVEMWQTFFQKPAMKQLRGHHYVSVSGEGYYMAYISASSLRLGCGGPSFEEVFDGAWPGPWGFDFDPKTEPPTTVDDAIYWKLAEPKILVILPHDSSNERVATYYSYLELFQKYVVAKKEQEGRMDAARRANELEDEEKIRQQEAVARQALLSP
ncbi:MAG: hypothetical protein Q7R65_02435 [bacterium]|nr:hypothetical protein [bacterium]